ncbi:hypothetical protein JL720_2507 [Aureococcus anophagefferens]|nr:hypothetical protein JL720_2507 [Aureococcus anophagefferens]
MDMDGLGLRHLRAIPGALAALRLAEPNYPERLKRIFIVRAPPAFHAVYRALRPALNAGSADKVRVLDDGEAYDALLAHMPAATIPRSSAAPATPRDALGGGGARDVEPPPETPKKPKKPKTPRAPLGRLAPAKKAQVPSTWASSASLPRNTGPAVRDRRGPRAAPTLSPRDDDGVAVGPERAAAPRLGPDDVVEQGLERRVLLGDDGALDVAHA